jgi:hypothetical protein
VGQEPDHQVLVLADPLDALGGGIGHVGQGGTREVGQLEVLKVGPQVFDWVELGRVAGSLSAVSQSCWLSSQARMRVLQCELSPSQMSTTRWPV